MSREQNARETAFPGVLLPLDFVEESLLNGLECVDDAVTEVGVHLRRADARRAASRRATGLGVGLLIEARLELVRTPRRVRRLEQRHDASSVRAGHRGTAQEGVATAQDRGGNARAGRGDVDDAQPLLLKPDRRLSLAPAGHCWSEDTVTTPGSSVGMSWQPALICRVTGVVSLGLPESVVLFDRS